MRPTGGRNLCAGEDRLARRERWPGCSSPASIPARCRSAMPSFAAPNVTPEPAETGGAVHKHLLALAPRRIVDPPLRRAGVSRTVRRKQCWQAPPVTLERHSAGHEFRAIVAGLSGDGGRCLARCRSSRNRAGSWPARPGPVGSTGCCRTNAKCWSPRSSAFTKRRESIWFASRSRASFRRRAPWYDVSAEGLVVWPDEQREVEVLYDLDEDALGGPASHSRLSRRGGCRRSSVGGCVFAAVPIEWEPLGRGLERGHRRPGPPPRRIVPVRVLPL